MIVWSTWLKSSVSSAKNSAFTTHYKVAVHFILRLLYCHSVGVVSMWCLFAVVKLRCSIFESCVTKEHCCFNTLLWSTWPQQNLCLLQESCKGNVQGNWLDCGEKTELLNKLKLLALFIIYIPSFHWTNWTKGMLFVPTTLDGACL